MNVHALTAIEAVIPKKRFVPARAATRAGSEEGGEHGGGGEGGAAGAGRGEEPQFSTECMICLEELCADEWVSEMQCGARPAARPPPAPLSAAAPRRARVTPPARAAQGTPSTPSASRPGSARASSAARRSLPPAPPPPLPRPRRRAPTARVRLRRGRRAGPTRGVGRGGALGCRRLCARTATQTRTLHPKPLPPSAPDPPWLAAGGELPQLQPAPALPHRRLRRAPPGPRRRPRGLPPPPPPSRTPALGARASGPEADPSGARQGAKLRTKMAPGARARLKRRAFVLSGGGAARPSRPRGRGRGGRGRAGGGASQEGAAGGAVLHLLLPPPGHLFRLPSL